jgi:hypothetical protein
MTLSFQSWDDDDRERYSPERWAEVRSFLADVFQEVDRPHDWLVRLEVEVRGDESSGSTWSFAPGLTVDQRRDLQKYLVAELVRDLDRPELPGSEG